MLLPKAISSAPAFLSVHIRTPTNGIEDSRYLPGGRDLLPQLEVAHSALIVLCMGIRIRAWTGRMAHSATNQPPSLTPTATGISVPCRRSVALGIHHVQNSFKACTMGYYYDFCKSTYIVTKTTKYSTFISYLHIYWAYVLVVVLYSHVWWAT